MLYFDTSFLAPLIFEESSSRKIETFFAGQKTGTLFVSGWTRVEFASLLAREVRMGGLPEADALRGMDRLNELLADSFGVLAPAAADFELAQKYVLRFDTKLRGGDALHLAIAVRHGAECFFTLDKTLLRAAKLLKIAASDVGR